MIFLPKKLGIDDMEFVITIAWDQENKTKSQ
jgi:hypothetical protein